MNRVIEIAEKYLHEAGTMMAPYLKFAEVLLFIQ